MSALSPTVRNTCLAVLSAGAAVSLSACGLVQSFLGTGNVMELQVGDCFNMDEMDTALSDTEVSDIPLVDCAESHDSEFFHSEILPEGDFPGQDELWNQAEEICEGEVFTEFIGVEWLESEIHAFSLTPMEQGWKFGDREILCYAVSMEPVTGSLQGVDR